MDTMKQEKGGAAHVLWIGPKDENPRNIPDEETLKLKRVCGKLCDSSVNVWELAVESPSFRFYSLFVQRGWLFS